MTVSNQIRRLHELIAAIDRRRPQTRAPRPADDRIARDAHDLRTRAVQRLSELQSRG